MGYIRVGIPGFSGILPSCGPSSGVQPNHSAHVVGHVGQSYLGRGPIKTDSPDEQAHPVLKPGKDVFDLGARQPFARIGLGDMRGQRKRYSAEFKTKVSLEAIRGALTMAQLVSKRGVHQTMINAWREQAIEGMAASFSGEAEAAPMVDGAEIDQLVVELDFLHKASGR
jgi:transposase